jgi:hypothetical protein
MSRDIRDPALKADGGDHDQEIKWILLQVSIVFILISCYYAMVLTNWATLQNDNKIDNPKAGRAAMWLQASGQWIALLLYIWALIAPRLFPDRDFS